ncbi:cytochrome b N-terminal domain-containing protein [Ramlibacter sp.]|uniref:cytochrome b N-terminal domain-containing protein n=1 Tax=Ramlibacter sp. TaxID=1917967 RepID=UPI002C79AD70|nr:cytochrome b N-terminal domain-containing protein [Ramlibacter sp.]HWI83479.1 cytochrome b N-terminal domain-containing protein [Ramlibacter sp.]
MQSLTGGYRQAEHLFDAAFGGTANPLKQLGALAIGLLGLLAATGAVLYVLLDTSADGAYRSIESLSRARGSAGSLLRGLHRYAADAFMLVTLAHLAREWLLGRFRGFRWFSWLTGVPLLPLALAAGIVGFWLNWDRLGQFSAVASAEWLDALPWLGSPLARNFLGGVGDRLFSLLVFVHLGLPLLLLFGLWFHLQRLSRPAVWPRLPLALGTAAALAALAWLLPVRSQGPADLATMPRALALDWWLLFLHPLADATSATAAWIGAAALLAGLAALPFLARRAPVPAAVVDPAHCNGCRRCADDCPYGAIAMVPHPNGRRGLQLAQVDAALCAGCAVCVGACPSGTPFRVRATLATGIDLPQSPLDALRRQLGDGLAAGRRHVVFGCDHAARAHALAAPDVLTLSLPCAGMLPPSFVDFALRQGAASVVVGGCRAGGCEFRLGQRWTAQRLAGAREPHLRRSVPPGRWTTAWADAGEEARVAAALASLRHAAGAAA